MSSAKPTTQPTEKAYPNVKTIILKENDPGVISTQGRPGVWKKNLNDDITLKDGDSVLVKESFIDTRTDGSGLINITEEIIDQLEITTGCYWQDSGSGVPIERYNSDASPIVGINYKEGGPEPLLSHVRLSEDPAETPNGKNYILQNSFADFTNTKFYLNTDTVNQDGAAGDAYSAFKGNVTVKGFGYDANANTGIELERNTGAAPTETALCTYLVEPASPNPDFAISDVIITNGGVGYQAPRPNGVQNPPMNADVLTVKAASSDNARFTLTQVNIPLTLELVPNSGYNPGTAGHQYYDYQFSVVLATGVPQPTWALPQTNAQGVYPLFKTTDLVGLRLASDPAQPNHLLLFPHSYSVLGAKLDVPPPPNGHIATIISSLNAAQEPEWNVIKNDNWDRTNCPTTLEPNPVAGTTDPAQGWVFQSQTPGINVSFNTADQPGLYRVCTGFWAWVWSNNPTEAGTSRATYPAQYIDPNIGNSEINNWYNITLEYYAPGNSAGGGSGANRTHKVTATHEWNAAVGKKAADMNLDFYIPQFPPYVNSLRAGAGYNVPDSDGFPCPESQFPIAPFSKKGRDSMRYPSTQEARGGTFVPVWFSAMPDTSSTPPANAKQKAPTFDPFIYNANPSLELGATDPDAINFNPFRISCSGSPWGMGDDQTNLMENYQQCGFVQQDNRGPIKRASNGKYVPTGIPPVWNDLKGTSFTQAPEFRLTNDCVLSRPYVPTGALHMTPRVYTTKLKDIPGNNLPILSNGNSVTYTYASWARLLTDTLNKIQTPIAGLSNQPSLPANPDPPNYVAGTFPLNNATYTASRILTDTVQLGYQGKDFPSNRFGVGWGRADGLGPVATYPFKATSKKPSGYLPSEQPYWISEDGKSAFQYKDGPATPTTPIQPKPEQYATVDPVADGNNAQVSIVFGKNGPKWVGAESLSIIFNDESSAFEIVQMHSNLYSASSGAVITKQFRSGTKGTVYPGGIQNLTIADQSSGIYITDWQPKNLWEGLMQLSPNTLIHNGGNFIQTAMNFNSFQFETGFDTVNALPIELVRGVNITGNFKSNTGLIDKRVNIIGQAPTANTGDPLAIGGNYASPVTNFNLQSESNVPVTILGSTIVPTETADPFFMIELKGMNSNSIYGMQRENALISSIVGRYYVAGSYTIGDSQGAIEYVHRGEPMTIRQLGIRILNAKGDELSPSQIKNTSAIIIQINGQDISIVD